MSLNRQDITTAVKYLKENYPDAKVNNNKKIEANENSPYIKSEEYKFVSMKQSFFKNVHYIESKFENVALTGSTFENIMFANSVFTGSSFANCSFYNVSMNGDGKTFEANNFSLSNFEQCKIVSMNLFRTGVLNTLFHNCEINNVVFHGSTFEGSSFVNCTFSQCDLGSVNLDYTIFAKNNYKNVLFPLYQIAYIIGSADLINDDSQRIYATTGTQKIDMREYREQIDRLILFYWDKSEYFPMCNLYIAKKDYEMAKDALLKGINFAISSRNFRMINNFCQLAKYHGIMDEKVKSILNHEMDEFILSKSVPESQLNYYLMYIGNIRKVINDGSPDTITLNYRIKTSICKKNEEGIGFVNNLVNDLNFHISKLENVEGFEVSISNHSPFEIVVNVIGLISSAATIASSVWQIVTDAREKTKQIQIDSETISKYIDARIDCAREQLLRIQSEYSDRKLRKNIAAVMQSLKTDLEELYTKDVMIFKLKNKKEN